MKRFLIVLVVALAIGCGAWAQDVLTPTGMQNELTAALQDLSSAQLGTLTVADVMKLAGRVSVAEQKIRYVQRASAASMFFPGAGQFMTGDTVGGVLFLTGDLAVITGALVGAYYLLPTDLRFDSLNYYTDSITNLKAAWMGHSIKDYLPSFGVMAGGMLVKVVLGHFAARSAASDARKNIADGKITFTPNFDFMGNGFMMGMRMRM